MTNPTKDAPEIINEISDRTKQVWSHKDSPEDLSKIGNELAVLNFGLGAWLGEFEDHERNMKTELELDKATQLEELLNKTDPATDKPYAVNKAENRVTIALGSKRREYNKTVSMVSKIKTARSDTSKVIDMVRTRISLIKQDIQGVGQ